MTFARPYITVSTLADGMMRYVLGPPAAGLDTEAMAYDFTYSVTDYYISSCNCDTEPKGSFTSHELN